MTARLLPWYTFSHFQNILVAHWLTKVGASVPIPRCETHPATVKGGGIARSDFPKHSFNLAAAITSKCRGGPLRFKLAFARIWDLKYCV